MKRFLVSLIAAIPLAFGAIAFTAPSTTQTGPPVPGPTNPYCNSTNLHPVPVGVCPEGFAIDPACMANCYTKFENDVREAYDHACIRYASLNNSWSLGMSAAVVTHALCVFDSTTIEQVIVCDNTLVSTVVTLTDNLNEGRADVAQSLARSIAGATAAYQRCISYCCTVIEDEQ